MKQRDVQLDMYRGAIMILITSVTHVIYWLKVPFINNYLSLILFGTSIMFFIAGAAFKMSTANKRTFLSFIHRKFRRIGLPYYIYLAVMLLLLGFNIVPSALLRTDYVNREFDVTTGLVVNGLLFMVKGEAPMSSHLWFVLPYLVICSLGVFLRPLLIRKYGPYLFIAICLAILAVFDKTAWPAESGLPYYFNFQARYIIAYSAIFAAGFLYRSLSVLKCCIFAVILLALLVILHFSAEYSLDIQANKFPPNLFYTLYSLFGLSILGIIFSYIKLPEHRVLKHFNTKGYTIYLYQNVTFFIVLLILDKFALLSDNRPVALSWTLFVFCFFACLFINYHLSSLISIGEKYILEKYDRLSDLICRMFKRLFCSQQR